LQVGNFTNFCPLLLFDSQKSRKMAELIDFNRGVQPFFAACCFDELSRGSVLCLLNASFRKAISQRHNLIFYAKIDDHGIHWVIWGEYLPNGGARWHLG